MNNINLSEIVRKIGLSSLVCGAIILAGSQTVAADSNEKDLGDVLLYSGKSHEHVSELKELLEKNDYLENSNEDWNQFFDSETKEAVKEFQEDYDLLVDGIPGVQTLGALSTLEKGDESNLVLILQEDLAELSFYTDELDGKFGPLTEEALINFQEEYDVEGDDEGIAGPYTFSALHPITSRYNPSLREEPTTESVNSSTSSSSESNSENTAPANTTASSGQAQENNAKEASSDQATFSMEATAYTAYCEGCSGITATGIDLRNQPDKKVVAVDPKVIPLGSIVEVEGYGRAIAGDTGGAIKGKRIDLHMATKDDAFSFGRRQVQVTVIETP